MSRPNCLHPPHPPPPPRRAPPRPVRAGRALERGPSRPPHRGGLLGDGAGPYGGGEAGLGAHAGAHHERAGRHAGLDRHRPADIAVQGLRRACMHTPRHRHSCLFPTAAAAAAASLHGSGCSRGEAVRRRLRGTSPTLLAWNWSHAPLKAPAQGQGLAPPARGACGCMRSFGDTHAAGLWTRGADAPSAPTTPSRTYLPRQ